MCETTTLLTFTSIWESIINVAIAIKSHAVSLNWGRRGEWLTTKCFMVTRTEAVQTGSFNLIESSNAVSGMVHARGLPSMGFLLACCV